MDPNACIDRINLALADQNWDEVLEACEDLNGWLEGGGFSPNKQIDQDLAAEHEMTDPDDDDKAAAYAALANLIDLFG